MKLYLIVGDFAVGPTAVELSDEERAVLAHAAHSVITSENDPRYWSAGRAVRDERRARWHEIEGVLDPEKKQLREQRRIAGVCPTCGTTEPVFNTCGAEEHWDYAAGDEQRG